VDRGARAQEEEGELDGGDVGGEGEEGGAQAEAVEGGEEVVEGKVGENGEAEGVDVWEDGDLLAMRVPQLRSLRRG
jgi:hypothetical protein